MARQVIRLRAASGRFGKRIGGLLVFVLLLGLAGSFLWTKRTSVRAVVRDRIGVHLVEGFAEEIDFAARESEVDPHLLAAIVFKESRGRPEVVSSAGALGLTQVMPSAAGDAARKLGLPKPSKEDLLTDPALNLRMGAKHLAWLLDRRGDWTLEQVLVAYNAGRQRLFNWMRDHGSYGAWREQERGRNLVGDSASGALNYALDAIAVMDHFRERGVIRPVAGLRIE